MLELFNSTDAGDAARSRFAASFSSNLATECEALPELVGWLLANVVAIQRIVVILLVPAFNAVGCLLGLETSQYCLILLRYLDKMPSASLAIQRFFYKYFYRKVTLLTRK